MSELPEATGAVSTGMWVDDGGVEALSGDASHESDLGVVDRIYFSHETLLPSEASPCSALSNLVL